MSKLLEVKDLHVTVEGKEIIKGIDLVVEAGKLHVIMGPNGSGKSTFAYSLLGHPKYEVTKGDLYFLGENINDAEPDERARAGMFLGFQQPVAIPGLALNNFLMSAARNKGENKSEDKNEYGMLADKMAKQKEQDLKQFHDTISGILDDLKMKEELVYRDLNDGFSGGEKKKVEIMQMALLNPKLAILDEPDSGLDIDALKLIAKKIDQMHKQGLAVILVTHYQRILKFLNPDKVHVLREGKIIKSGEAELAKKIEEEGYEKV